MHRTGKILVVDEEVDARAAITALLEDAGHVVATAGHDDAVAVADSFQPHVVLTDTELRGDELLAALDRIFEMRTLRRELVELRERMRDRTAPDNLVGTSASMHRILDVLDQVASSRASVLITGESGTGKELVANVIHERSSRANGPFVELHCAGLTPIAIESELFGHERDAFPGATNAHRGHIERAAGGTIFLDEVDELPPSTQVKLLRFLQDHEIEHLGGGAPIKVDARLIAATTHDLLSDVGAGKFRQDLFYRLDVISLQIPPLRARRADIPVLAKLFLDRAARDAHKVVDTISPEAMEILVAYDWPGNVRELEQSMERAVILARSNTIEPRQLPPNVRPRMTPSGMPIVPGATMADLERYAILETLKATNGSTSKAAEILGISTRTIQYRIHDYNAANDGVPTPGRGNGHSQAKS